MKGKQTDVVHDTAAGTSTLVVPPIKIASVLFVEGRQVSMGQVPKTIPLR
jgi:alpha-glucosidase